MTLYMRNMMIVRFGWKAIRLCGLRKVHDDTYTPVPEFYKGKSILITGATGFTGQCLVEKLLRSCPDIDQVYIPIRAKRGVHGSQRFRKFLNNSVFDRLRQTDPKFDTKIIPLWTNLEKSNLGLCDELFQKLINEVSIIFHVAALIKFNASLSDAIRANVLVSTNVVRFGKQCKHLEAYIHVSSLYTHIDRDIVDEKVYPTERTHEQLIDLMNDGKLGQHKSKIVGRSPGTYFATKKVGEYLTKLESSSFPAAILRPGIISPSLREPIAGWSYGVASYIQWMKQVEKGEMHCTMGLPEATTDIIPIDMLANCMIVTAWYLGTGQYGSQPDVGPLVVNAHANLVNKFTNQDMCDHVNAYMIGEGACTRITLHSSRLWVLLRYAPYVIHKSLSQILRGERPMTFYLFVLGMTDGIYLVKVKNNVKEYKNLDKIENSLSDSDKKDFSADVSSIDWKEYIRMWLSTIKLKREANGLSSQTTYKPTNYLEK